MATKVFSSTRLFPPFPSNNQLDSTPLTDSVIPGEYVPVSQASTFLRRGLDQTQAEKIQRHLWFGGPPGRFRTLHYQEVLLRKIVPCEESSLHLIWNSNVIWIKPLPPCLTNYEFFKEHICNSPDLYILACGFLFSYSHLIRYYSDFRLAKEKGLFRDDITWIQWQSFRLSIDAFLKEYPQFIHRRYQYGDLRLSRLNFVYFCKFMVFSGYHNAYTHYGPYFSSYFASAIIIFAFASVTLAAMQVALAAPSIDIPDDLAVTSYRFSIAILVSVAVIMVGLTFVFIPIVISDLRKGLLADAKLAHKLKLDRSQMKEEA
jgi:hypothetical protein